MHWEQMSGPAPAIRPRVLNFFPDTPLVWPEPEPEKKYEVYPIFPFRNLGHL